MVRKTRTRKQQRRRSIKRRKGGSKSGEPIIIRFWLDGCGACAMSEDAWTKFEKESPIKTVKIESKAIPPEWNSEVKAFPTYIVVVDGKKVAKEQGAITDLSKLKKLANKGR